MNAPRVRAAGSAAAAALLIALTACAGTSETASQVATPAPVSAPAQGRYKVGKPYQIKGIWYYPRVDYSYDEVGIASWYGPGFHGEMTANGEIYDMNDMTAAHKTLPLPCIVRVTNLENGRTLKLRVNDRGPFVGERIIDVSRRAAQMLGFHGAGTAQVRVQIEAEESQQLAAALTGAPVAAIGAAAMPSTLYAPPASPAAPQPAPPAETAVAAAEAPALTAGSSAGDTLPPAVIGETAPPAVSQVHAAAAGRPDSPAHFVQAGAFADPANAAKARSALDPLGPVEVKPLSVDGRPLVRVRVGPLGSEAEAQKVLVAALRAGFTGSRLVVE
jgi:rare lipoprotein A